MKRNTRYLTQAALTAALYAAVTHAQNLLLPGSATWAVQFRASEALLVLACFTPAAVPGLTAGCVLFNLTYAGALPLDFLVGGYATFLSAGTLWLTRRWKAQGLPRLLAPAVCNGLLVGWELTFYLGSGAPALFLLNALYVALGELAVLATLGTALHRALSKNNLARRLLEGN